jgi:hypothetical protein
MTDYDLTNWPLFRSVVDGDASPRSRSLTCAVVAGFADADPAVRRDAETIAAYIIRPALIDTDYAPIRITDRADDVTASDAVLMADLVIAVLSGRNPETHHLVAIAQSAGKPLLLLIEDGQTVAIDTHGAPVFTYTLDTAAIVDGSHVRRLQALLSPPPPARAPLTPGAVTLLERSGQFGYDQRLDMMRQAMFRIDIMGVANLAYASHPDMRELLRQRSGQSIEIRVLQCAPANPGLNVLMGTRDMARLSEVRNEIEAAADAWKRLLDTPDLDMSIIVRRAQNTVPLASAIITDKASVATPYLYSRATSECPTWFARAGTSHHAVLQQEFDLVWSEATTILRLEPRATAPRPANANAPSQALSEPLIPIQVEAAPPINPNKPRGFFTVR